MPEIAPPGAHEVLLPPSTANGLAPRELPGLCERADQLVQIYLSFFSLSKVRLLAKRITSSTFASIVDRWSHEESGMKVINEVGHHLPWLLYRYTPWLPTIPRDDVGPDFESLADVPREG